MFWSSDISMCLRGRLVGVLAPCQTHGRLPPCSPVQVYSRGWYSLQQLWEEYLEPTWVISVIFPSMDGAMGRNGQEVPLSLPARPLPDCVQAFCFSLSLLVYLLTADLKCLCRKLLLLPSSQRLTPSTDRGYRIWSLH